MKKMKAAILSSGKGSNADAIFNCVENVKIKNLEIGALISDIQDAPALNVAKRHNIPSIWIDPMRKGARFTPESAQNYIKFLKESGVELVILAGFMRILPPEFVSEFSNRAINLHPSLLPAFKGKDAIKQAFDAKAKKCGCTVHFVSDELDGGKIISQKEVEIFPGDTLETLEARVHEAEHILLPSVIADIASGKIKLG